jgi:hypothetical protein
MRRLSVPFLAAAVFVTLSGTQGRKVRAMQHESRSIQPENAKSGSRRIERERRRQRSYGGGSLLQYCRLDGSYVDSDVTLVVDIECGVAEINLEVV